MILAVVVPDVICTSGLNEAEVENDILYCVEPCDLAQLTRSELDVAFEAAKDCGIFGAGGVSGVGSAPSFVPEPELSAPPSVGTITST